LGKSARIAQLSHAASRYSLNSDPPRLAVISRPPKSAAQQRRKTSGARYLYPFGYSSPIRIVTLKRQGNEHFLMLISQNWLYWRQADAMEGKPCYALSLWELRFPFKECMFGILLMAAFWCVSTTARSRVTQHPNKTTTHTV
jgi:hypothetical protein